MTPTNGQAPRVRPLQYLVIPMWASDDGTNLSPIQLQQENGQPVPPISISSADWPNIHKIIEDHRERIQAQINDSYKPQPNPLKEVPR